MNDANAVGDERNGFQPVVTQQQLPQLCHFLVQIEIIGQVRFALSSTFVKIHIVINVFLYVFVGIAFLCIFCGNIVVFACFYENGLVLFPSLKAFHDWFSKLFV